MSLLVAKAVLNTDLPRQKGGLLLQKTAGVQTYEPGLPKVPAPPMGGSTSFTRPPAPPGPGLPSGPPVAPSPLPKPVNPLEGFDPSAIGAALGSGSNFMGTSGGQWTPMQGDYSVNQKFEQTLLDRLGGNIEGLPTYDEMIAGSFDPMAKIMDAQYNRAADAAVENMISRGVLDSSEAGRALADLSVELANNKAALLGQLGLDYAKIREESIQNAISSYGILEGNRLQAKTSITTANIGAAASVQNAAINAGATREAALIGAQARLQEAGLNARVALEGLRQDMDKTLIELGIDPVLFANDEKFRGRIFEGYEYMKHQEELLNDLLIEELQGKLRGGAYA